MLFNSLEYALFLPIVFLLYWFVLGGSRRGQNLLLLTAGYVFYGWWDWRFLSLLFLSSVVDYTAARVISEAKEPRLRRACILASLTFNLGLLATFKYFNFFIDSFADLMRVMGVQVNLWSLTVVLPVGISFYTFQSISYTLDVYFGKCRATRDPITFLAYVSFFPQLMAGPIERARHLLPQFERVHRFDPSLATEGCRQIVWGLFKKMVIADNAAIAADRIFASYQTASTPELILGVIYFAFQIYGDFSGYSDIALGSAKLFGVRLIRNFHYPYFSRNMAEFWRRWHISLSSWFRDYVYIPLGGSRNGQFVAARNLFIVFLLSGLWHGANWTFIVWGLLNAAFILPSYLARSEVRPFVLGERWTYAEYIGLSLTFLGACVGWVFFRSMSVSDAWSFLSRIVWSGSYARLNVSLFPLVGIIVLVALEWRAKHLEYPLAKVPSDRGRRWLVYLALWVAILTLSPREGATFIYFQF